MLERVDFFIRDISAIPVADTARIWSRCLNEINYLKNRKNSLVREGLRSLTPQPYRRSPLFVRVQEKSAARTRR